MEPLAVLADVISDVGYWRWWASDLPRVVQLEFGGVQLARPGADSVPTPVGTIALRFRDASGFAFLTRVDGAGGVPEDWPERLAADTLEAAGVSTALSFEMFSLGDEEIAARVLAVPHRATSMLGVTPDLTAWCASRARVAFWAGAVGASVVADRLEVVTHGGPLTLDEVPELRSAWWTYWRAYWDRRGTAAALPYDGGCEVTIPIAPA